MAVLQEQSERAAAPAAEPSAPRGAHEPPSLRAIARVASGGLLRRDPPARPPKVRPRPRPGPARRGAARAERAARGDVVKPPDGRGGCWWSLCARAKRGTPARSRCRLPARAAPRAARPARSGRRWAPRESSCPPPFPPPPPFRADWTRLVPPPVLTGHVSSFPRESSWRASRRREGSSCGAEPGCSLARRASLSPSPPSPRAGRAARRVRLVRSEGRGVSTEYEGGGGGAASPPLRAGR